MFEEVEVLRAACCIAGVDGEVSPEELPLLKKLAKHAGVGEVSLNAMIDRALKDPNFYQEQFKYLKADPDVTMKLLFTVAIADGVLHVNERVILQHLGKKLGMSDQRYEELLSAAERRVGQSGQA